MRVSLALQTIASRSVACALKQAHQEKLPGFEEDDVLVTADFIELHDQLFDIFNSRQQRAPGSKAALSQSNINEYKGIFNEIRHMYDNLYHEIMDTKTMTPKHQKLIHSRRKTSFLGLLACMDSCELLVSYMETGILVLQYLRTYALQQVSNHI